MVSINFNPGANTAQSSLDSANKASNDAINKLASGNRITSAKDDVAGLAVGTTLQSKVQTLKSSSINIEQANSLLQVADGSMKEIGDILKRQSSLAQQASSGALDSVARGFLQEEFSKLESEIDRIAENTNFNNLKLINGDYGHSQYGDVQDTSFSDTNYPVNKGDLNVTQSDGTKIGELHDSKISTYKGSIDGAIEDISVTYDSDNSETTIHFQIGGKDYKVTNDFSSNNYFGMTEDFDNTIKGNQFTNLGFNSGLTDPGDYEINDGSVVGNLNQTKLVENTSSVSGAVENVTAKYEGGSDTTITITIGGTDYSLTDDFTNIGAGGTTKTLDDGNGNKVDINYKNDQTDNLQITDQQDADTFAAKMKELLGGSNKFEGTGTDINLKGKDSNNILNLNYKNDTNGSDADMNVDSEADAKAFETALKNAFKFGSNFQVGTESNDSISVQINNVTTTRLYDEQELDISEGGPKAQTAKDTIDEAINKLSSARANVGALQSRFENAGNVVDTATTNQDAARSTFLDADMAQQSTNFAQAQVKTQSSISMLAQANNLPQQLLKLIG
jgi:flagellin